MDSSKPTERGQTDDSSDAVLDRRTVLRAVGGTGLAVGLAGCSATDGRTYEAEPVGLGPGAAELGYELRDRGTVETESEVEQGEDTVDVSVVSRVASYARGGEDFVGEVTVGAVSTPVVEEFDEPVNPLAEQSVEALLVGEEGRPFLRQLDLDPDWQRDPQPVRAGTGTLFESEVQFRTYAGITAEGEFALVDVVRVDRQGDAVLVADARTTPVESAADPLVGEDGIVDVPTVDRCVQWFAELLPTVVYGDDAEATEQTARVELESVPEDIRWRANLVIDRFSGDHQELWSSRATLGDVAYRVSRPDVDGVAYYELGVEPEGYVVCATGRHDHPVPNFATEGRQIGRELESRADEPVATLIWIDRQRIVAENADGEVVATRGNYVYRIEDLEQLAAYDESVEVVGGPGEDGPATDDEVTRDYEPTISYRNDSAPPEDLPLPTLHDGAADEQSAEEIQEALPLETWESHDALTENYEEAFGPLLEDLRERAEPYWEALADLQAEAQEGTADGTGTDAGDDGEDSDGGDDTAAGGTEATAGVGFAGRLPAGDVEVESVFDDLLGTVPEGEKVWAGGWEHQVYYYQFVHGDCIVGCGPVAWAILFGWADRQAEGGPYEDTWWPRWGLYREDGGYGEGEGVPAPTAENRNKYAGDDLPGGVENVIEELHEHCFTWCDPTADDDDLPGEIQAATHPVQMPFAAGYFSGRTGTGLTVDYNVSGIPTTGPKGLARDAIAGDIPGMDSTPAIIGTGWLSHYPIAYAFSDGGLLGADYFKVNNGWGNHVGDKSEWVWAPTWFGGTLHPRWD